jgi:hypothetical protein
MGGGRTDTLIISGEKIEGVESDDSEPRGPLYTIKISKTQATNAAIEIEVEIRKE